MNKYSRNFCNFIVKYKNVIINAFIFVIMLALATFRIKVEQSAGINFPEVNKSFYDSFYFAQGAINFDRLNNAIQYGTLDFSIPVGLIKNRAFIWFLMLFKYLNITPQTGIALLWIVAAICIYIFIYKLTSNKIVSFLAYCFTLFHPIAFLYLGLINLYRNTLFIQITIIYISLLFFFFYSVLEGRKTIINILFAVLFGITLLIQFLIIETGIVHILVAGFLTISFLIFVVIKNRQLLKKSMLVLIGFVVLVLGINTYKFINYRAFGVYEINMRTEGPIGDFIGKVQSIESRSQNKHIWCSVDQIKKAYEVSQTLKDNKNFYDHLLAGPVADLFIKNEGYVGDFLSWGIINSMIHCKMDYIEGEKFFTKINKELDFAFKYGLLKKTNKIALSKTSGRYTGEELSQMINITADVISHYTNFKNFVTYIPPFEASKDFENEYFEFFNIKSEKKHVGYAEFARELTNCYTVINTILTIMVLIALSLVVTKNIISLRKYLSYKTNTIELFNKENILCFLMIVFALFYILHTFAISGFLIWMYHHYYNKYGHIEALYYNYASTGFAFMIFTFVFAVSIVMLFIRCEIKKFNVKEKVAGYLVNYKNQVVSFYNTLNNKDKKLSRVFISACTIISILLVVFLINTGKNCLGSIRLVKIINEKKADEILIKKEEKERIDKIDKLFTNNKRFNFKNDRLVNKIKARKDIIDNLLIIGDSYATFLERYVENNLNYKNKSYIRPAHTLIDNFDLYDEGINSNPQIILYSFSVNDHQKQTDLKLFKEKTDELFKNAHKKGKILITHSYMRYYYPLDEKEKYTIDDYDYVLKKCASYYDNVVYIDLKDIQYPEYREIDKIHYNINFYNEFLSRAFSYLTKYLHLK